jgi:hypothetical protein
MTTTWYFGVDWRRKGVICWDAQPGDALNLFPQPLRYTATDWRTDVVNSVQRVALNNPYGIFALRVATGTGTNGLILGQDNALVANDIPVNASTTYSVGVYLRGESSYSGVNCLLRIKAQNGTTLVTSSAFMLTADWQQQSVTFTTAASTTHLVIEIVKQGSAANVEFSATGFMLVVGSTVPGYNAGHAVDLYDTVTARVMQAEWFLGMKQPYQLDADNSRLNLSIGEFFGVSLVLPQLW